MARCGSRLEIESSRSGWVERSRRPFVGPVSDGVRVRLSAAGAPADGRRCRAAGVICAWSPSTFFPFLWVFCRRTDILASGTTASTGSCQELLHVLGRAQAAVQYGSEHDGADREQTADEEEDDQRERGLLEAGRRA